MDKKGQEALHEFLLTIMELAIAGFVSAAFFLYIGSIESGAFLEKNYKARDLSLIIEALESSPGSVFYYYNDRRGFIYKFEKNRIDVYAKNERFDQPSMAYYFFPENKNLEHIYPASLLIPVPFEENTQFAFQKGYDFSINHEIDENIGFMHCPKVNPETKTLILRYEKEEDRELSKTLQATTVATTEERTKEELEKDKSAVFIYIKYKEGKNVLIYTSTSLKSRSLACLISNELRKKNIGSLILPDDFDKERAYLVIEMDAKRKNEIGLAIYDGLSKYMKNE